MRQAVVRGDQVLCGQDRDGSVIIEEAGKLYRPGPIALGYGRQSNRKGVAPWTVTDI